MLDKTFSYLGGFIITLVYLLGVMISDSFVKWYSAYLMVHFSLIVGFAKYYEKEG